MVSLHRWQKRLIMLGVDLVIIPVALWFSFALRLDAWEPVFNESLWLLVIAPLTSILIFARLGLYRSVIRFLGSKALATVFAGVSISVVALFSLTVLFAFQGIPYSVFIIYWGVLFLLIGASRYLVRRLFRHLKSKEKRINIAIYGAGDSGAQLANALLASKELRPVLFLDDDLALQKSYVNGLKIYSPSQLAYLTGVHQIKQLLLAIPSAGSAQRSEILHKLEGYPIHVRTIPSMEDLVSGGSIADLREIEFEDLLRREAEMPNQDLLSKNLRSKRVMVTGAGGSIGSELCRQIITQYPKRLVLFEISEIALYQTERELIEFCQSEAIALELVPVLGSVQNQPRVAETIFQYEIQTIYHAAAYKHMMLLEKNPVEGMQNNALGAYRAALAAHESGVERFILISSDQAVRPSNLMGASKSIAELSLQALSHLRGNTIFSIVRFGNAIGSSGTVVPLFRQQIESGGPITITHPEISRCFMTIPEVAQLVIQAGALSKGGEVFSLDMGKPVKIVDLAKRMIRFSGLQERTETFLQGEIAIEYTGLRAGEKLYEEQLVEDDVSPTLHPKIFLAYEEKISWDEAQEMIDNLTTACNRRDIERIYTMLRSYVSGFKLNVVKKGKGDVVSLPLSAKRRAG